MKFNNKKPENNNELQQRVIQESYEAVTHPHAAAANYQRSYYNMSFESLHNTVFKSLIVRRPEADKHHGRRLASKSLNQGKHKFES